jgi:uncharacterized protein
MTIEISSEHMICIAVVADTHVPDRVKGLHPQLISGLANQKPDYIFHAGDISHPKVLSDLREVAPVYAVRGNRDILFDRNVTMKLKFLINGLSILLIHGHLNPFVYWSDKFDRVLHGYQFNRFLKRIQRQKEGARMCIYGHSHYAENQEIDGVHYFNPGSCTIGGLFSQEISFGVIKIQPDGRLEKEIVPLNSYFIKSGKWVRGD